MSGIHENIWASRPSLVSTGRSFKWSWPEKITLLEASSLTDVTVRNRSYQRPLCIWFGSTTTAQVTMTKNMCLNGFMQQWKREATHNTRINCKWTYLRSIEICGIRYRKSSLLDILTRIPYISMKYSTKKISNKIPWIVYLLKFTFISMHCLYQIVN